MQRVLRVARTKYIRQVRNTLKKTKNLYLSPRILCPTSFRTKRKKSSVGLGETITTQLLLTGRKNQPSIRVHQFQIVPEYFRKNLPDRDHRSGDCTYVLTHTSSNQTGLNKV